MILESAKAIFNTYGATRRNGFPGASHKPATTLSGASAKRGLTSAGAGG
ncbi:MAG TPA: hypothetical protein VFO63_18785 [Blastocatellia bacterium]|nr:hypothetical protein [Blastocatellia bacterium]